MISVLFSTSAQGLEPGWASPSELAWGDCAAAIASRLAPTVFRGDSEIRETPSIPCGSEPARDGGGSGRTRIECCADDYAASAAIAAWTLGRAAIRAMNEASTGQSPIWILNDGSQFKTVNR
ncbi:hypothetical protein SAMN04488697_104137 [Pseudomonas sp. 43mfcvi1.1]|nr:hypothetical protein ATJ40_104137 [Pseudomonas sp. 43mfcvi1.1]SSB96063.1 hypothetical protein SAMN04488697_104137 [Pseudomonas sp. 43mfcvi1.1]